MPDEKQIAAGMMWYRRDQWDRWRDATPDWDEMSPTYEAWLREAKKGVRLYQDQGITVQRVDADLEEFLDWCRYKGVQPDGAARSQFAADQVRLGRGLPIDQDLE